MNTRILGAEAAARWEQFHNVSCRRVIIGWEGFEETEGIVEKAVILTTVFYSLTYAFVAVNLITLLILMAID